MATAFERPACIQTGWYDFLYGNCNRIVGVTHGKVNKKKTIHCWNEHKKPTNKLHTFQSDISRESQRPQHDQTLTWSQHSWPKWMFEQNIEQILFVHSSSMLLLPFSSACVMRYVYNRLWHPKAVGDGCWTNAPCTAVEIFASPKPHVTVIQMIRKIRGCLEISHSF